MGLTRSVSQLPWRYLGFHDQHGNLRQSVLELVLSAGFRRQRLGPLLTDLYY